MDTDRFDGMTKALAIGASRRRLVKRAAGSALAGVLGGVGLRGVGATHKEGKRTHRCTPSENHSCEPGSGLSCPDESIICYLSGQDWGRCIGWKGIRVGTCAIYKEIAGIKVFLGCAISTCESQGYRDETDACNKKFPTECQGKCIGQDVGSAAKRCNH
jgi:hypothetical protein